MPDHSKPMRLAFRAAYGLSSRIVGVTNQVARYQVEQDGAPAHKTSFMHTCANPSFFPSERNEPKRRTTSGRLRLLHVGRLQPVKNHDGLLRAIALMRTRGEVELDLVGAGPLEDHVRTQILELGLHDRVRMIGFCSDPKELYASSHIFVLPSHSEGCSIALIEAMASGLHCVGSTAPGIVEVLGDHATRWTAPASQPAALAKLLDIAAQLDDDQRVGLGRALQERAYVHFSPKAYMRRLRDLYGAKR